MDGNNNFLMMMAIILVFMLPVGAIKTHEILEDNQILTTNKFVPTNLSIKIHSNMNYTDKLSVKNAKNYLITSKPKKGKLTMDKNGKFNYIPNKNFMGTDTFNYRVTDGNGNSNIATVTITVYNNAPIVNNKIKVNTSSYTQYNGKLNSIDKDGDVLTYKIIIGPENGTLKMNKNGSFTYMPNNGFRGTDCFTYKSNDGINDSNIGTLTVITTNSPPLANNVDINSQVDKSNNGKFISTDIDNDSLKFSIMSLPKNGKIKLDKNGTYRYMPNKGFSGTDSFTYKSNDGFDDSNIGTVTLLIKSPPFANDVNIATTLNIPINGELFAKSGYNTELTYKIISEPLHGNITLNNDGNYVYTPNQNFQGTDQFTYKANNGFYDSNIGTVTIIIINYPKYLKYSNEAFTNPCKITSEIEGVY